MRPSGSAPQSDASTNDPYDLEAGTREHYEDALLYDWEYRRRRADVNHYRRLANELGGGRRILELGCGTGRVLVALARDGHDIVGIDLARPMLLRAAERVRAAGRAAAARVLLVQADMRRFALDGAFPLAICPFNAFQHLYTRQDVAGCLESVRALLAPSGRFALDVLNPDLRWLTRDSRKRWARTVFKHPRTGAPVEYTTNQTYDPIDQIAYIRLYYREVDGDRTHVVRLAHRQFFPAELEALLAAGGFLVEERWGGFDREPLVGDSDSQVLLCRVR